jgi:leucyl aminopeptidase
MKYIFNSKNTIEEVMNTKIAGVSIRRQKKTEFLNMGDGKKMLVIGVPKDEKMNRRKFVVLVRNIVRKTKEDGMKKITVNADELFNLLPDFTKEELAEIVATNFEMANYEFNQYKTKPEEGWNDIEEVIVVGAVSTKFQESFRRGKLIGEEVNKTRTLANMPGSAMTPTVLAHKAVEAVKGLPVKVKILHDKDIKKLKMGALLGVAQGSTEPSKFIIMEYMGAGEGQKPIVLVGKGVTFDTGGLNIKTEEHMFGMNMDMSGGAAVIHTIALAARLKVKKNIVVLVPAVENSPSGHAYRPGDVLKSMSGKMIEVLNTDAEGRLILADALTYAKRYNPMLTIDVATLTGSVCVALGEECSGIFTKDDGLADQTILLGERSGDYMWRLPLWEEYDVYIKSRIADIANLGHEGGNMSIGAGAITAAAFLYAFAKDISGTWLHIDMASRMTTTSHEKLADGAAGAPVRLLLKLVEEYKK